MHLLLLRAPKIEIKEKKMKVVKNKQHQMKQLSALIWMAIHWKVKYT